MCHDIRTADRFYVKSPDVHESLRIREIVSRTLSSEVDNRGGSTTGGGEEATDMELQLPL